MSFPLPFLPIREDLYTPRELLLDDFDERRPSSLERARDLRIYRYFVKEGRGEPRSHFASMMESLHDNSMSQARQRSLGPGRGLVGVMGGHELDRRAPAYGQVLRLARRLTRAGLLVVSGGGPGAMEAAHVGAALASAAPSDIGRALRGLEKCPQLPGTLARLLDRRGQFDRSLIRALHRWWIPAIRIVRELGDSAGESLAFPTWYYGHEPVTPFATSIAKYFQNSIREDGLIAISNAGVVFTTGKAGTVQEIFQDACQNFYARAGRFRPMVFLGEEYWRSRLPAIPLLEALFPGKAFRSRVCVTDDADRAAGFLLRHAGR